MRRGFTNIFSLSTYGYQAYSVSLTSTAHSTLKLTWGSHLKAAFALSRPINDHSRKLDLGKIVCISSTHSNFCLLPLISFNPLGCPLLAASRIKPTAIFPTTSHANNPTAHAYPITGNKLSGITPKTSGSKT
jgi:hypothetical protein